jgi:hypothetical protein
MVLEVRSNALAETRLTAESLEPADGQALLSILRFGCTANNVTYALLGETLGFGRFFPAPVGWTRVPAWGVAEVVATRTDTVSEGERFFGYCPMATEMLLTPRAASFGVVDVAEHRASLMPAYNAYRHPDAGTSRSCCGRCSCSRSCSTRTSSRVRPAPCCFRVRRARRRRRSRSCLRRTAAP